MSAAAPPLPSLATTTIRRSIIVGSRYLVIGMAISLLLTIILVTHPTAFALTFPLELPLFTSMGSIGAMMLFANDRTKGVYEYLISYGVPPRTLFALTLLSAATLAAVVLFGSLAVGIGAFVARGNSLPWGVEEAIAIYTIPMTLACALFATMVSMIWASVASPRAGLNSPVGFAPMLSTGPAILVLLAAESAPAADYYYILGGAAALLLIAVAVMVAASGRLLSRERLLSGM
jgi:hypothetical protein